MSNLPQPIKNLGKSQLSKAADKFVDFVITKYTGKSIKVFEAEGDIEADKVKTRWEILEKPFWLQAEAAKMNRQYSNMGVALMKAAPWVIAEENKITDDNDVFWGLLEHSKEISNEQMQDLIAKIIAGEYNQPGTYSMSTLQVIKSLGKSELEKFEKNCTVLINNLHFLYNFYSFGEPQSEMRVALGINYKDFVECQNLGLVQTNAISQNIDLKKDEIIKMVYFDKPILLKTKGDVKNYTLLNIYQLTNAGQQILQHLSPMPSDLFYNWAKKHIAGSHFEII